MLAAAINTVSGKTHREQRVMLIHIVLQGSGAHKIRTDRQIHRHIGVNGTWKLTNVF